MTPIVSRAFFSCLSLWKKPLVLIMTSLLLTSLLLGASSDSVKVLTLEQFGGSPQSVDNTAAFEAAIAAAKATDGPVVIQLQPSASYRVQGSGRQACAIMIKDVDDLTFDGQGATLIITDPTRGGLRTEDCESIVLKNFAIDYDPLPYTVSTVTDINVSDNWFEIAIEEGYPSPGLPFFEEAKSQSGLMIVPLPDGGTRFGPDVISPERKEDMGNGIWRIYPKMQFGGYSDPLGSNRVTVGERFVLCARTYEQALSSIDCTDLLWENITVYASPGLASYPRGNEQHTIRGFHVAIREGRIFSSNADGIHMRGSRGDVLIEGCTFEGMGDDGINVHSSAMAVTDQPAANQAEVRKHTYSVRVGDRVVAVNSSTAQIIGEAEIVAIEDCQRTWLLTFDRDLVLPTTDAEGEETNAHGAPIATANLYNLDESASPFVVRDCVFNDFRGRGLLISARDGVVEDNVFRDREGWGIVMHYESSRWAEGPISSDILIRNNTFIKPYGAIQPAIVTGIPARSGDAKVPAFFEDIRIENNTFYGWEEPLRLKNMDGLVLVGNEIFPDSVPE